VFNSYAVVDLLAPALRSGADEEPGGLPSELLCLPERAGGVEECLHLSGHGAVPRRRPPAASPRVEHDVEPQLPRGRRQSRVGHLLLGQEGCADVRPLRLYTRVRERDVRCQPLDLDQRLTVRKVPAGPADVLGRSQVSG